MLKELRQSANLTQKKAAELLGVPYRTYQDWECGKRCPPQYVMQLVIDKLKSLQGRS